MSRGEDAGVVANERRPGLTMTGQRSLALNAKPKIREAGRQKKCIFLLNIRRGTTTGINNGLALLGSRPLSLYSVFVLGPDHETET